MTNDKDIATLMTLNREKIEYIRKDIVPQDQVRAALSGLDGLMGATFWNTNDAKHEWAEWANKNRDILRALLVAHGCAE